MSDDVADQAGSESALAPAPSALRQARERAGLHVVALAAMLKVPVQRLEALEAGRYQDLPDVTFARALASSVCRVLKIDPAPVLASLPASSLVRLGDPEGALNAPMPTRHAPLLAGASAPGGRRIPWSAAVALLVLVAAVTLWFLLPSRADLPEASPTEPAPAVTVPTGGAEPTPAPVAPVPVVQAAPAEAPQAPVDSAIAAPSVPVPVPAPDPVEPAPTEQAGVLQLQARGASWVQVSGASGRVLLQRGLQAGERVSFSADLPLTVVVGRVDETQVTVRGAAFDLAPHTRNNVARFEVQ